MKGNQLLFYYYIERIEILIPCILPIFADLVLVYHFLFTYATSTQLRLVLFNETIFKASPTLILLKYIGKLILIK